MVPRDRTLPPEHRRQILDRLFREVLFVPRDDAAGAQDGDAPRYQLEAAGGEEVRGDAGSEQRSSLR
jgi:hypothetical protein